MYMLWGNRPPHLCTSDGVKRQDATTLRSSSNATRHRVGNSSSFRGFPLVIGRPFSPHTKNLLNGRWDLFGFHFSPPTANRSIADRDMSTRLPILWTGSS